MGIAASQARRLIQLLLVSLVSLGFVITGTAAAAPPNGNGSSSAVSISLSSPSDGQTVSGSITWTASVGGNVKSVDFAIDGAVRWTESGAPYVYNGDGGTLDTTALSNGAHTLTVTANGPGKQAATAQATVTVSNPAPTTATTPTTTAPTTTTTAPSPITVTTTSPANGQTVSGAVQWIVSVTGSVSHVDFAIDGSITWTESSAPYVFNGDGNSLDTTTLTNGSHVLRATAVGADGATASTSVTVNVSNPSSTAPALVSAPTVSGSAVVGGTLTASTGSWSGSPTSYTYAWARCDSAGSNCSSIAGAAAQVYIPVAADVGSTLRTVVTASNAAGTSSANSDATGLVQGASGAIPTHIETWAYDDGDQGVNASASLVTSWVTYAESRGGTKALTDRTGSSTKAFMYLDPNRIYSCTGCSVPIASGSPENWWLHIPGYTDSSHRLSATYNGTTFAGLLNDSVSGVAGWFQNYVRANFDAWDGFMVDDASPSVSLQVYGSGYSTSQEVAADSQVVAMHQSLASALTHSNGTPFLQVDNTLSANPYLQQGFNLIGSPAPVRGLIAEGFPVAGGSLTPHYSTLLDSMAYVDQMPNGFLVLMSYDASGTAQWRRVHAATILLGYAPGHTVSWSNLDYGTNQLAIFPEEGIYPTQPVQTMGAPGGTGCLTGSGAICTTGGHNNIQVAPGVYRREFAQCYNRGTAFGRCAVIVNTTGSPVATQASWFTASYGHTITMVGGTVQAGGSVNLAGGVYASGATVPAKDALLLAS